MTHCFSGNLCEYPKSCGYLKGTASPHPWIPVAPGYHSDMSLKHNNSTSCRGASASSSLEACKLNAVPTGLTANCKSGVANILQVNGKGVCLEVAASEVFRAVLGTQAGSLHVVGPLVCSHCSLQLETGSQWLLEGFAATRLCSES